MSAETIRRIEGIELFRDCRRSQLEMIDRLGTTITLPAGRVLCTEGRRGSEFFLLLDGLVEVQSSTGRLALLHAGGWFGESALIDNAPRRASVTTVVDSTVIVFDRREFSTLRDIEPRVRERMDNTAFVLARGEAPMGHPWYQPIGDPVPVVDAPVAVSQARA